MLVASFTSSLTQLVSDYGLYAVLGSFLTSLADQLPSLPNAVGRSVSDTVLGLLASTLATHSDEQFGAHPVPGAECNCGFHAARDPVDALSYARGRDEPNTVCRVLGEVRLWGHVLETEGGWRASHATA